MHLVGFIKKKFVKLHGHRNVKKSINHVPITSFHFLSISVFANLPLIRHN